VVELVAGEAVGARVDDSELTFASPDGEAPPRPIPDVGPPPDVDAALQRMRWSALPGRTTETLRTLLKEEP